MDEIQVVNGITTYKLDVKTEYGDGRQCECIEIRHGQSLVSLLRTFFQHQQKWDCFQTRNARKEKSQAAKDERRWQVLQRKGHYVQRDDQFFKDRQVTIFF